MSLLKWMIKEEWRMHSSMFGSLKFSLFPLVILLISIPMMIAFNSFGFSMNEIQFGMHYLMLFFGLNVGVIGFVSRSSMRNLMGEKNLIIFSSRLLPVSKPYILANFIVKDFLFYFGFFIFPVILSNFFVTSATNTVFLGISYLLSFGLGLAFTFVISVVYSRFSKYVFIPLAGVGIYVLYTLEMGLRQLNLGYLYYLNRSIPILLFNIFVILVLLLIGGFSYGFQRDTKDEWKSDRYSKISERFSELNSKNLLDLHRSSGGFGKILVSYIVLGAVFWFIVDVFPPARIFLDAKLLAFSTFLGISSLSVYNWLNRYDRNESYYILPLAEKDVLKNKIKSFYILISPLLIIAIILAFLLFGGSTLELVHSFLIAFFTATYILAITVKLTGMEPNIKLLDTSILAKFFLLAFLILEPFLVGALLFSGNVLIVSGVFIILYLISGFVSYRLLFRTVQ